MLPLGTAIGVVVYTGSETRSVMNTSNPETKVWTVELQHQLYIYHAVNRIPVDPITSKSQLTQSSKKISIPDFPLGKKLSHFACPGVTTSLSWGLEVKSPQSHLARSYVARNQSHVARNVYSSHPKFYHAQQHPNILVALVSFHQIFKNKMYYSFDVRAPFHQG